MDVDDLKTFVDVYRAGGFAPVARDRGVAPSSVSRCIAGLEAALQARLFQRTTRHLAPTDAGDLLFRRMVPLVEELEAVRLELSDSTGAPSGRLRVTASVSYGQICIVPRLAAFRAAYPDIALDLILSDAKVDLLAERIDLAVRHGKLDDSGMIARKLADVRYRLVASPAYLATAGPIAQPADVAHHPCIAFSYEGFRSVWRFRNGSVRRDVDISPAVTLSNAAAIRQCACEGLGPALLADWTIETDIDAGRLVDVLPDWEAAGPGFDAAIWLMFPSRRFVPAKTRAFAAFLGG